MKIKIELIVHGYPTESSSERDSVHMQFMCPELLFLEEFARCPEALGLRAKMMAEQVRSRLEKSHEAIYKCQSYQDTCGYQFTGDSEVATSLIACPRCGGRVARIAPSESGPLPDLDERRWQVGRPPIMPIPENYFLKEPDEPERETNRAAFYERERTAREVGMITVITHLENGKLLTIGFPA